MSLIFDGKSIDAIVIHTRYEEMVDYSFRTSLVPCRSPHPVDYVDIEFPLSRAGAMPQSCNAVDPGHQARLDAAAYTTPSRASSPRVTVHRAIYRRCT